MDQEKLADFEFADLLMDSADELIELTWKKPFGSIPPTVYHYTNSDGLFGILKSKQIWATDYRFLNDYMEGEIGLRRAKDLVRSEYFKSSNGPERLLYKEVLEVLRIERADNNFLFSLSSRRDDLNQWRAYANEGEGFTIGFDTKKILELANKQNSDFGFGKVSYSSVEFDKKVRAALRKFEKIIQKQRSNDSLNVLIEEAALFFETVIGTYSVAYKHSSFRSEFEWRVNTFIEIGDPDNEVLIRSNGRRLVPYVEIKLCGEDEDCLPITSIGIGPGFRDSGVRYAVERLCRQSGIKAKIYNADTPFRRV